MPCIAFSALLNERHAIVSQYVVKKATFLQINIKSVLGFYLALSTIGRRSSLAWKLSKSGAAAVLCGAFVFSNPCMFSPIH